MKFYVGQHVYVAYELYGTAYRAVIREIHGGAIHMNWVRGGGSITAGCDQLTPVPALVILAEGAA